LYRPGRSDRRREERTGLTHQGINEFGSVFEDAINAGMLNRVSLTRVNI
jgi:hypothetical protein